MKLSKAQQTVVDKMREGWKLIRVHLGDNWIKLEKGATAIKVNANTFYSLRRLKVVEKCKHEELRSTYQLTEKYKNEQK